MKAEERARELLAHYPGPVPVDVEGIAEGEGLEVVEWRLHVMEEMFLWPCIAVQRGLSQAWRRWVIAHALGHHLLHRGNQLWFRRHDDVMRRRQEVQAEQFAAWLLMPQDEVGRLRSLDLWHFAEYFGVPQECVTLRFPK